MTLKDVIDDVTIICDRSTYCKIRESIGYGDKNIIWIDGYKKNADNRELIIKTFKESL